MATATLLPDGTITSNWDTQVPGSGSHHDKIDEGTGTPDDNDYIETTTLNDADEFSFGNTPANTDTVTQIALKIRTKITDGSGAAFVRCELFHSSGTPVTGNPKDVTITDTGGSGTLATVTKTWSGLSLTKAQADSLQLRVTFKNA